MSTRIRDKLGRGMQIAIVVAYVGVLLVLPLVAIVWGALSHGPGPFLRALVSRGAAHALLMSVILTVIAVAVNTVFGVIVAWVLTRDQFPSRSFLNALVDLPLAISPVIVGLSTLLLFGRRGIFPARGIVFHLPGMALVTIFVSIPFVIRQVGLVLAELGTDEEQVAYTLGASPLATFFRVTLPGIRWGLLQGILLTTARALGEFGAVLVVSGGLADLTETGTLFVFRSLDDRRDLAAYSVSVALAAVSIALLASLEILRRRQERARA